MVGNCGFGCFPIGDPVLARKAIYGYSDAVPIEWRTAGGYFDRLEQARPAINVLSLVPNGQLRLATVGLADRPADTRRDWRACGELLRESLGEGAWGYSTGLEYAQESGATEEEITALCRALDGQLYATHTRRRDEGAVRVGRGGDPHRRARGGAAAGLAPRAAQRDRGVAPLDRAGRARPRPRPRRRVRHAHAPLRDHAPLRGAAAVGARRRTTSRALLARPRRARPDAPAPQPPQRRQRLDADRPASTTRSGPSTRAATSPRSPPSAARSRSTRSTTCSCRRSRTRTS